MARFGTADVQERFFGAAVYLFAIYDAISLGGFLIAQIPALEPIFQLLRLLVTPVSWLYLVFNMIVPLGFGSLVVFFILYIAVVRNENIAYFIRFNTLQSILFGIAISLISIVFGTIGGLGLIGGLVFIIATGASLFCIAECIMGRYPEIPTVSAAAYSQLPR
ncbi:MAG: Tic20 family protein [Cyanobacteria bacterium P01_C01_bin.72]